MSSKFDLCGFVYVIRLAGWLTHCNVSPSLSVSPMTNTSDPQLTQLYWACTMRLLLLITEATLSETCLRLDHDQV